MRKVLLINSWPDVGEYLIKSFDYLQEQGYEFWFYYPEKQAKNNFHKLKINKIKKIFIGPRLDSRIKAMFFLLILPLLVLKQGISLVYLKKKRHINTVVCFGWRERIIFSPLAKILKINNVWIDHPRLNYKEKSSFFIKYLKSCSGKAKILVFTKFDKKRLIKLGFKEENIVLVPIGINLQEQEYQDNLFSSMAKAEKNHAGYNKFTLGTVVDLNYSGQLESFLKVVKICVNVIPELQVIIVGEGKEKKNLTWLVKKMDLEKVVWFVGNQNIYYKWLDDFNVYIALNQNPSFFYLRVLLRAMSYKLPVVALKKKGFEDVVKDDYSGFLVNKGNKEDMARKIIELYQKENLRCQFGENGHKEVKENYNFKVEVKKIKKVL